MDNRKQERNSSSQNDNFQVLSIKSKRAGSPHRMVEVSDGSFFYVHMSLINELRLVKGTILDVDGMRRLIREARIHSAYEKARDYVSRRDHAAGELVTKLVARGVEGGIAEVAVERCEDTGIVDDAMFSAAYIHERIRRNMDGPAKILSVLLGKGVSYSVARNALDTEYTTTTQEEVINTLLQKRYTGLINECDTDKLYIKLKRKGFEHAVINTVFHTLF